MEEDPTKYYEKIVTDPFRQLLIGREYRVDGTDMIYSGSRGNNRYGEGENSAYNFRTPVTVTPTSSKWIRADDFNKHDIIQKSVSLNEIMLKDKKQSSAALPGLEAELPGLEKSIFNQLPPDIKNYIIRYGGKKKRKRKTLKKNKRNLSKKYKKRKTTKKRRSIRQSRKN